MPEAAPVMRATLWLSCIVLSSGNGSPTSRKSGEKWDIFANWNSRFLAPLGMTRALLSARQSASGFRAVDGVNVPAHVGRIVGREESKQRRNFLRPGVPTQRDLPVHLFEHLVGIFGALHGSEYVSGRDRAHPHLGREFQCA